MSQLLVLIAVSVLVPAGCFGLLFWLAWLEDTLVDDVRMVGRRRAPQPIVAIALPQQRQPLELVQTFPGMRDAEVPPVSTAQILASPDVAPATATA